MAAPVTYAVTVPSGVSAGDEFPARLGDTMANVIVPVGCGPGSLLNVHMDVFVVPVPHGVPPGQQFMAEIGGQVRPVVAPYDSTSGEYLHVQVPVATPVFPAGEAREKENPKALLQSMFPDADVAIIDETLADPAIGGNVERAAEALLEILSGDAAAPARAAALRPSTCWTRPRTRRRSGSAATARRRSWPPR